MAGDPQRSLSGSRVKERRVGPWCECKIRVVYTTFGAERGPHRHQFRRTSPEQVRPQRGRGRQEGRNRRECAEKIADRVRQFVTVRIQAPGRRPTARGSIENHHVVLDLLQRTAPAGRSEIRKTADRGPAFTAVEPGNAHRNRRLAPVGPVPHQPAVVPATALQARRKACVPPRLAANILLGGQCCLET